MAREDLIEIIDNAVSWMVAAQKEHPELLLPAWVDQWLTNRPTKRAPDASPRCAHEWYHGKGQSGFELVCSKCGERR